MKSGKAEKVELITTTIKNRNRRRTRAIGFIYRMHTNLQLVGWLYAPYMV